VNDSVAGNGGPRSPGWDVLRLVMKGGLLLSAVFVSALVVVLIVPDGNDYALATRDKHRNLGLNTGRKIVFVGGSNLAYGLDSSLIAKQCGTHVVNMGMNGYLGVRFMLEEIKENLRPSDQVVISLEYDSYYKSPEGSGTDLLMIAKARPASLRHMTPRQLSSVAQAVPFGAQQKARRVLRGVVGKARRWARNLVIGQPSRSSPEPMSEELRAGIFINSIESYAGFNEYGDLTRHLGVKWPYEREDGINLTTTQIDRDVIAVLRSFSEEMKQRGVTVLIIHGPVIQSFYDRHRDSIQRLQSLLTEAMPEHVASSPERYVFPEPLFFDTVYHLTAPGRTMRTQQVLADISAHTESKGSDQCSAGGVPLERRAAVSN
jgi:hypothetical protein